MYELTITYEANKPNYAFEREICDILGTSTYDAGFGFGERDMEFMFNDFQSASLAKDLALKIEGIEVHGITEIEDDEDEA